MSDARFLVLLAVIMLAGAFAAADEEAALGALLISTCLFGAAVICAWIGT